ncbi:MAG: class I SAM-dependent methyltransferase [Anaerolineae bacterium]|jgi:SAM-dependent methyltransferase|nr:class I SAM-dependent methyltransferase [Anaerolineae bacterium]
MNAAVPVAPDYRELLARYGRSHWWIAGMRGITWAVLGRVNGRLLDVGCGPGWLLAELPPGLHGVGIDIEVQFAVARPIVESDSCNLPFPDSVFDVVTALDVLEQECVEPQQALAEVRRVLVPGGRLLIRVPAYPRLYGPHDLMWGGARRYQREELSDLVRNAGFTVRRLTFANSLLLPISAAQRLAARSIWSDGNDVRPLPAPLNRLLLGVLALEARWLKTRDLRAGLSLLCMAERDA